MISLNMSFLFPFISVLNLYIMIVFGYNLNRGCPPDVVYRLPPYDFIKYETYSWIPSGESRSRINEVVTHYKTYKGGNITVAICYRFSGRNHYNNRPPLPKPIVGVVQAVCYDSPCDAGHVLPSVMGGRDIITNIIPQYANLNRGVWSSYEKKIFEQSLDGAIVMTIFEYDPRNDIDMKFLDPEIKNLFIKQPKIIRSVTIAYTPSVLIQFCGTFKNDRSVPKSPSVDVDMILARWRSQNPTNNYGVCG